MVRRPPPVKPTPVTYVRRPRRRRKGDYFDILSTLIILFSVCILAWFVFLYNNPNSHLNPLPPASTPTLPPTIVVPVPDGATKTEQPLNPSDATEDPSRAAPTLPGTVETPYAAATLPGPSQTVSPESGLPIETAQPKGYYSFAIISAPNAIQASTLNPDRDCNWMGLGGYVLDIQNRPATSYLIQMGGYINNKTLLETSLSGTVLQYGPSGYEFTLEKKPINTRKALWVRLVDQSMQPISDKVVFDTYADCNRNLILVNFKQIK